MHSSVSEKVLIPCYMSLSLDKNIIPYATSLTPATDVPGSLYPLSSIPLFATYTAAGPRLLEIVLVDGCTFDQTYTPVSRHPIL